MKTSLGKKAAAVVVSFHPDSEFESRVEKLFKEFALVVVVDNASGAERVGSLKKFAEVKGEAVQVVENRSNLGVAAAFNQGAARAFEQALVEYVMFFDQDSDLPVAFMEKFQEAFSELTIKQEGWGLLAANYRDVNKLHGRTREQSLPGKKTQKVLTAITSGTLIRKSVWFQEGPYEEGLFIDHVDDEYCLRLARRGYSAWVAVQAVLNHRIGSAVPRKLLGKIVYPMNQSPLRWFYVSRNILILSPRYFLSYPAWVLSTQVSIFNRVILMLLFENRRAGKVLKILQGVMAAIRYWIGGSRI